MAVMDFALFRKKPLQTLLIYFVYLSMLGQLCGLQIVHFVLKMLLFHWGSRLFDISQSLIFVLNISILDLNIIHILRKFVHIFK
jgi:hypothetical protein